MIKQHHIDQNTPEWHELRAGRFTASSVHNLFMKPTSAGYKNEICRVVGEKLSGKPDESPDTFWMRRGHELEPYAADAYAKKNMVVLKPGGFYTRGEYVGASPDRLVNDEGLLEIKCFNLGNTIKYGVMLEQDKKLKWQLQTQLYCTGRDWVDNVFYHPDLPDFYTIRTDRDETIMMELDDQIKLAVAAVEDLL